MMQLMQCKYKQFNLKALIPYASLIRCLFGPFGIGPLFVSCLWGLNLSQINTSHIVSVSEYIKYCLLFFIGSFLMRGAGCIWNDLLDRDIDARIQRTKTRPLASKKVPIKHAIYFLFILIFCSFIITLFLPVQAMLISWCGLPLAAIYPTMKRITHLPQLWLGITFNWGIPTSYFIFQKHISLSFVLLYIAAILWTIGYDTIYAWQDINDDKILGVKSTTILFEPFVKEIVICVYVLMFFLLASIGWIINNPLFWPIYSLALLYIVPKLISLDKDNKNNHKLCSSVLTYNTFFGLIIALALLVSAFK